MPRAPRTTYSRRPSEKQPPVDVATVAKNAFGWASLRPGQREAMEALVAGRDVLLVMPTGAGKSAVYQVPALVRPGPTLVVSPLLALQQDQAEAVGVSGETAVRISSSGGVARRRAALEAVANGTAEYVFCTPEQLANAEVAQVLRRAKPSLVAVDEAHCVSTWGHDFRPDYLQVGRAIEAIGRPPIVALTATAAPPVRDDIVRRLRLRDPLVLVRELDRPEIELAVKTYVHEADREAAIIERALSEPSPGIVYTTTRKACEHYAAVLADSGLRVAAYHGGQARGLRERVQTTFMHGALDVVVATSAFGMGVDKADVRYVLHAATPDSPDSYVQEAGRAGRDGQTAHAVLFHRAQDLSLQRFLSGGLPDHDRLTAVAAAVRDAAGALTSTQLREVTGIGPQALGRYLNLLEEVGAVRIDKRRRAVLPAHAPGPEEAGLLAREEAERHQRVERSRLEMLRGYVETLGCRKQYLLGYLGEVLPERCGRCDNCLAGAAATVDAPESAAYPVNARVRHHEWGVGTVMSHQGEALVVLFESVGYKTLSAEVVAQRHLLARTR